MSSFFDAEISLSDIEQARAGCRKALELIYRRFEKAAYTLARRMCGDSDAARDITHDSFLRAFDRLHQYRGEAPFGCWLKAIVANQALMHLRDGRHFLALFEEHTKDESAPDLADISNVDLEHALALLAPVPRAVLWLYHVEGYTHAEIANLSGKTVSFSKSQLSRAHGKLKQRLCAHPEPATGSALTAAAAVAGPIA